MGWRFCGGVWIILRSRTPMSENCSVRGMGVAVSVKTSTEARNSFSFSFTETPKRCSSSITKSPKSLNFTSLETNRCVPMAMSTFPAIILATTFFCSAELWKRERLSICTGKSFILRLKVRRCWSTRIVVGAIIATCRPLMTALNAARTATSVLPKPTSPHTNRSIAVLFSISRFTSWMAFIWSGVSSNSNRASISTCQ